MVEEKEEKMVPFLDLNASAILSVFYRQGITRVFQFATIGIPVPDAIHNECRLPSLE